MTPDGSTRGRTVLRYLPAIAFVGVFVLLAVTYLAGRQHLYFAILNKLGFTPYLPPFIDAKVVLSAADCHAQGIDVYRVNPCDPLGRVHIYSPLLLYLPSLGLHASSATLLGLFFAALFAVALGLVFRPSTGRQALGYVLATLSYPIAFAVERGQFETVIFFLAALACVLYERSFRSRCVGYGLMVLAGLLKFFPIALLVLAVK
jgi:hypothetical protein